MADLATIALSASASVLVQSIYYLLLKFPGEARDVTADLLMNVSTTAAELSILDDMLGNLEKCQELFFRTLYALKNTTTLDEATKIGLVTEHRDLIGLLRGVQLEGVIVPEGKSLQE